MSSKEQYRNYVKRLKADVTMLKQNVIKLKDENYQLRKLNATLRTGTDIRTVTKVPYAYKLFIGFLIAYSLMATILMLVQ